MSLRSTETTVRSYAPDCGCCEGPDGPACEVDCINTAARLDVKGDRQEPCGQKPPMVLDEPMSGREVHVGGDRLAIAERHLLEDNKRFDQIRVAGAQLLQRGNGGLAI